MKITELNIAEFGCFKDKKISFEGANSDLNIIYGENESGKSTILLFIKFMLYGLGRKSASNSERERSVSWSGHTAAGSMSFTQDGKKYRIERRYSDASRGGSERLSVICLDDGSEMNVEGVVGEYFLGVPREVFESSACVGQLSSSQINGERTAASIQNILSSADESVDASKILKNLDALRVTYRHKNKNGGSLYDAEQLMMQKRQELARAREASLSLDEQSQKLNDARRDYEHVKADFEHKDILISQFNKINLLKRFGKYAELQGEIAALEKKTEADLKSGLKTNFVPDRSHVAELKLALKAVCSAQTELDGKEAFLADKAPEYDEQLALLGKEIQERGGVGQTASDFKARRKKMKAQNTVMVLSCVSGTASIAYGIWSVLSGVYAGAVAFGAAAAIIVLFALMAKAKKKLKRENAALLEKYQTDAQNFEARLVVCVENFEAQTAHAAMLEQTQKALAAARLVFENAQSSLNELVKKTAPDIEPTAENVYKEIGRLEALVFEYEKNCTELASRKRLAENERDALAPYNEKEIKEQISIDVSEVTPNAMAEAERQRTFLLRKKEAFEQRIFALNDYVSQLKANAKNPLPIADELEDLQRKYAKECEFYDALTLAMESIEQASEVMSGSIMPAIAEYASSLMARISNDKYTALRTTSGLGALTLDSDGFGVKSDLLSSGTRDAAYISLRLALLSRIFEKGVPPIILDESLCQLDDTRCENLLLLLEELTGQNMQCLLFTSHRREGQICDRIGCEYNSIML